MKKILFVFALTILYSCGTQKGTAEKFSNNIELRQDEEILLSARANYQAKLFAQPGRLFLTNQRMYFRTSKLATKKFEFSLLFSDMNEVRKTGYNFKLGLGASLNSFTIILKDDTKKIFVTGKRKEWISEINKSIQ